MRIAFITTCHNRKEKTKRSLTSLLDALKEKDISADFYITDDGSVDGTSEMIQRILPDCILTQGDGNLFWNQGIRKSWLAAINSTTNHDFYFLFNDDTYFNVEVLDTILSDYNFIVSKKPNSGIILVGPVTNSEQSEVTYGALTSKMTFGIPHRPKILIPNGAPQPASTLNMNCALVNHKTVEKIGILDPKFHHSYGDLDYGLRLTKSGGSVFSASNSVGTCERNPADNTWKDPNMGRIKRLKSLFGPKGQPPLQRLIFSYRHGGLFWPFFWIYPYIISGILNKKTLNKRNPENHKSS